MYLGKRKVVAKGFNSGFEHLPKRISEKELDELVTKLRSGDTSVMEPIILGHLGLTIQIVGRYVSYFPLKSDDLMSVASLALTESVHNFPLKAKDNNITGYIVATIHGRLSDYLKEEDHVVQISSYGRKQALEKAKEDGTEVMFTKSYDIEFIIADKVQGVRHLSKISYTVSDEIEYQEVIEKCPFTRFEFLVYEKLMQGSTVQEIAEEMHYSKQRISQIKKDVIAKINKTNIQISTIPERIDQIVKHLDRFWEKKK